MGKSIKILLGLLLISTTGCGPIQYYSQAISGHLKIFSHREPVEALLASDTLEDGLRKKLEMALRIREFASKHLGLPDNDSYKSYVATNRRYVTWNVVAAERFSLQPKRWCFPVAGCVSYKGYFAKNDAIEFAEKLSEQGFDVATGGATAYSTLGWFDDPLLDTMMHGADFRLAALVFHELAHQQLYVKGDSAFNEAFASFVEQQGVREWLKSQNQDENLLLYSDYLQRNKEFSDLLKISRDRLLKLYERELPEEEMQQQKAASFEQMKADYVVLKESWKGYKGYDQWFKKPLNNARLVAIATYRKWIPAFATLYQEQGNDLTAFYKRAAEVAEMPKDEREQFLLTLLNSHNKSTDS